MFRCIGNDCVFPIGQGTTGTGPLANASDEGDRERAAVLRHGVDLGMNYIDTAELYGGGHAEIVVGKAIRGVRDRVFIASKFNPDHHRFSDVINALDGSLKRLGTDFIDLYQIHWPNPRVPIQETMEALRVLVAQGKIRYIGVSNFTLQEYVEAQRVFGSGKIVSNQVEYNLVERSIEEAWLPYSQANQIATLAYSPLDQGRSGFTRTQQQLLQEIAEGYDKTVFQVILRWIVDHGSVIAIAKSASMHHTSQNAEAAQFDLSTDDMESIAKAFQRKTDWVLPAEVQVKAEGKPVYGTVEEAMKNRFDLFPSPEILAENIAKWKIQKPIRLIRNPDHAGPFRYILVGEHIRYWAWVIAFGWEIPIPAYIQEVD
ncbi:aldo/keto reductase [Heliobacillus mobilis]|uniref:Aldo/keto reductase n=1 Tax=Heliobacterium mobile TaxID=28064 RepID=A0A6I3SM34_HELMO|nr:aldo/keto reductase [Heliobacterium mobile]MTV49682.1 aldo/keto reductase [Heliobacterium mobile]